MHGGFFITIQSVKKERTVLRELQQNNKQRINGNKVEASETIWVRVLLEVVRKSVKGTDGSHTNTGVFHSACRLTSYYTSTL